MGSTWFRRCLKQKIHGVETFLKQFSSRSGHPGKLVLLRNPYFAAEWLTYSMRRLHIFIIVLAVALTAILALVAVSLYMAASSPGYYGSSWMGQMWGGMGMDGYYGGNGNYGGMGGMMGNGYGATSASYAWVIPAALIAVSAVAVIGVAFYLIFPELRFIKGPACAPSQLASQPRPVAVAAPKPPEPSSVAQVQNAPIISNTSSSCDVLLKTMTPEEQKVLNVLLNHQGKYLQKYVVKEAGFSRLKTHRIVARFAERGIVSVKEFGNTNEIQLSDWVKAASMPKTPTF